MNNKKNNDDDDHAFVLADSFGIDTGVSVVGGDAEPAVATGGSIISAMVENTVNKNASTAPDVDPIPTDGDPSSRTMATAEAYTDNQFKSLTWDNFDVGPDNNPVGVFGIPFAKFNFKQIRAIGLHFKIPRARNSKKADTIAGLVIAY